MMESPVSMRVSDTMQASPPSSVGAVAQMSKATDIAGWGILYQATREDVRTTTFQEATTRERYRR